MTLPTLIEYGEIASLFERFRPALFGVADISQLSGIKDKNGSPFPKAVSFAIPMDKTIMATVKTGPNRAYAVEYRSVNDRIDALCTTLVGVIEALGFRAKTFAASLRTDPVNIRGDFPHKTAATLSGLGWVGKNCQLITRRHGPWIRLGTVFTDLAVSSGNPIAKSGCGNCHECVDACPANALEGNSWEPGIPRERLLDVYRCDQWKKEHYFQYNKGHNCGICTAACPFGK